MQGNLIISISFLFPDFVVNVYIYLIILRTAFPPLQFILYFPIFLATFITSAFFFIFLHTFQPSTSSSITTKTTSNWICPFTWTQSFQIAYKGIGISSSRRFTSTNYDRLDCYLGNIACRRNTITNIAYRQRLVSRLFRETTICILLHC